MKVLSILILAFVISGCSTNTIEKSQEKHNLNQESVDVLAKRFGEIYRLRMTGEAGKIKWLKQKGYKDNPIQVSKDEQFVKVSKSDCYEIVQEQIQYSGKSFYRSLNEKDGSYGCQKIKDGYKAYHTL